MDVELAGGPMHGHTTSMLTCADGVTPRAFQIVVPSTLTFGKADLRYTFRGLDLRLSPLQTVFIYQFEGSV